MINFRYDVIKKLGEGRSIVYLGKDSIHNNIPAALKILRPGTSKEESENFRDEFFTLKILDHPNIIKSFEYGKISHTDDKTEELKDSFFQSIEYFEGTDLLSSKSTHDENNLKIILKQICSVLYYLHQSNIIYFDLKPENILVSETNGSPFIKLIDLGLAKHVRFLDQENIKGTTEYIAPELLGKKAFDHSVDLYSLGIILYRIIYGKFPFNTSDELEIYKAHIEKDFEFPISNYSEQLVSAVKVLLSKDPSKRFRNSLEILRYLGIEIDEETYINFVPVNLFTNRRDILSAVKKHISDENNPEILLIKGSEGSGKSFLLSQLNYAYEESVLIESGKLNGIKLIYTLIRKIVGDSGLSDTYLFNTGAENNINELKEILIQVSLQYKYILLIDDFNLLDDNIIDFFLSIIPVLQVNKIPVIISEDSNVSSSEKMLYNFIELNLQSFTAKEVNEFVELSFYSDFPKPDVTALILQYSDLLPGSIRLFIKDLIFYKILRYGEEYVKVCLDEEAKHLLSSTHDELYNFRIKALDQDELNAAEIVSAIDIPLNEKVLNIITGKEGLTAVLSRNNIFVNDLQKTVFTSQGLKSYVYNQIKEKPGLHLKIAQCISENKVDFPAEELSRQFELAGSYEESYSILIKLFHESGQAYAYQKKLLQKLLDYPLDNEKKFSVKKELCKVLFKLNENKEVVSLASELLQDKQNDNLEIRIIRGSALIGFGEMAEGSAELNKLLVKVSPSEKFHLMNEIAKAELDLNNFGKVYSLCDKIVHHTASSSDDRGNSYNLLGLTELYMNNDFDKSLEYFSLAEEEFKKAKNKFRIAQMQMNSGNILNMKGERKKAKESFNRSLQVSSSSGNLDQEAALLVNFGIMSFEELDFDEAIKSYNRALNIFNSMGNKFRVGLVSSNFGETYIVICDYAKAAYHLENSIKIFNELNNRTELREALFFNAKLAYAVNDLEKLIKVKEDFIKNNGQSEDPDKLKYLGLLISALKEEDNLAYRFEELSNSFLASEDNTNFVSSYFLSLRSLIREHNYQKAYEKVISVPFEEVCKTNALYEAEHNLILGIVSAHVNIAGDKTGINFYMRSHEILLDLHVNSLTFETLVRCANYYFERGNLSRAKEYMDYAVKMNDYFISKLEKKRTAQIYMNHWQRKELIGYINSITNS